MMRLLLSFFLSLLLLPLIGLGQTNVLFLGNSYTAYNNLPVLVQDIANSLGDPINVDTYNPGGFTLKGHLNNSTALTKISQTNYGYVVLQEQSQIPTIPFYRDADMYPAARSLDSLIDLQDCVRPVFYMTWGRKFGGQQCDNGPIHCSPIFTDFSHMQDSLETAYMRIANELSAAVAPVGIAWENALAIDSNLNLWTSDNSHPTIFGSYLAACTMYATFFEKSPVGASFPTGITAAEAQTLQTAAAQTVLPNLVLWNTDTTMFHTVAGFTSTKAFLSSQFTNTSVGLDSFLWDFGDGTTSNSENPGHTYSQLGTYVVCLMAFGPCGNDTICDTLLFEHFNGVEQTSIKEKVGFYPNPAHDFIILEIENYLYRRLEIRFIDITGAVVKKKTLYKDPTDTEVNAQNKSNRISLEDLPKGIYFLEILDPDSKDRATLRLVRN